MLALLEARGISVADEHRATVLACDDLTVLQRWLLRAVTAAAAPDLFAP